MTNHNPDVLSLLLDTPGDILLVSHIDPDGDTMGSAYGLALWLRHKGRQARIYCRHKVPPAYEWAFAGAFSQDLGPVPDILVCIDSASADRTGEAAELLEHVKLSICIDHHYTNPGYCHYNYIDADASSTAEIILTLLSERSEAITADMAQALYIGLLTDSGQFSFSDVRANTLRMAALAVENGADVGRINNIIYRTRTLAKTKLITAALDSLTLYNQGFIAIMHVDKPTMAALGATYSDGENIVNYAVEIDTAEIGIFLKEQSMGYKASIRTWERCDAGSIAARLGGGGHVRAAGCTLSRDLNTALAQLKDALEAELGCPVERDI